MIKSRLTTTVLVGGHPSVGFNWEPDVGNIMRARNGNMKRNTKEVLGFGVGVKRLLRLSPGIEHRGRYGFVGAWGESGAVAWLLVTCSGAAAPADRWA